LNAISKRENALSAHISESVHDVFDDNNGVIPMPALTALTIQRMIANGVDVPFSEYSEVTAAIGVFVRSNYRFKVAKGKNGGVSRV
jgi:hypothetical protein